MLVDMTMPDGRNLLKNLSDGEATVLALQKIGDTVQVDGELLFVGFSSLSLDTDNGRVRLIVRFGKRTHPGERKITRASPS